MGLTISGLSGSGLDTTEIVKVLMEAERIPYTNLENKKTRLEQEQEVFRQLNTKLKSLDSALFDLKYSFNLKAYKATSSNNGISVKASDTAIPGKYNIEVTQGIKLGNAEILSKDLLEAAKYGNLKIGDIDFSSPSVRSALGIDSSTSDETLLLNIANYVNYNSSSTKATMTMQKDDLNGGFVVQLTSKDIQKVNISSENIFTINNSDFLNAIKNQSDNLKIGNLDFSDLDITDLSDEEILKQAVKYINDNSNVSNTSAYISGGNIKLASKDGSGNVDIQGVNYTTKDPLENISNNLGQSAVFKVNGVEYTRNSNEITDVIPGLSFTISDEIEVSTSNPYKSTITVSADNDKVADKVQAFVDAYNSVISFVRSNLAKPEQEGVINPLQGDSVLKDISSRLNSIFNQATSAGFMEEIGLSIDKNALSYGGSMTGTITFDREKFISKITENPSKVTTIVNTVAKSMSDTIANTWTSSTKGIMQTKIAGYDAELKRVDEKLEAMDRSLQMKEARLKQQYNNMEKMLATLNSTKDWLTSQFESLTKSKS